MDQAHPSPSALVSKQRQWDRLMAMARLGTIPGDGVNRACLIPLDRKARRLVLTWAVEAGASVSVDEAANLWLRRDGTDPRAAPVLTGSHMDTQPQGGCFGGIYGVIAALEAAQAMQEPGLATRRPVEIVAWTNEECGRFSPGSMARCGHTPLAKFAEARDPAGVRFADALAEHLAAEADLSRAPLGSKPYACVEPHIEQGPQLDRESVATGVVSGIQGSRWFTVTLAGETAHAGMIPLRQRHDAVQGFVQAIDALNDLMTDPEDVLRFTVGRVVVRPNTSNSVADRVEFTIDPRHPHAAVLVERGDAIEGTIKAALDGALGVEVRETFRAMPTEFAPLVPDAVEDAARLEGLSAMRMPSGAFHDAQFVAPICPAEYASPEALAAGTRVLARVLTCLAA